MTDLQIDWLRTFLAIVDTGSLTSAAAQVSRSQSAVSMQLKKLEESVGRPLLNRGPKHMSLTPAGFDLLAYARDIIELHSKALEALHGGGVAGRVSFGVPDDFAMKYLVPVMRTFGSRFPEVEVTLTCEPSASLLTKVDRGDLDLVMATRDTAERGYLLFQEDLIWVASEQPEIWKRNPLPIAVHGIDSRLRAEVIAAISARNRSYRVVYHSSNLIGQLAAAESGLAVAVITRGSLPPNLKALDIRNGLPLLPKIEVALVRSAEARKSAAVDALQDHVKQSFILI